MRPGLPQTVGSRTGTGTSLKILNGNLNGDSILRRKEPESNWN
jgi:hypothetical protein